MRSYAAQGSEVKVVHKLRILRFPYIKSTLTLLLGHREETRRIRMIVERRIRFLVIVVGRFKGLNKDVTPRLSSNSVFSRCCLLPILSLRYTLFMLDLSVLLLTPTITQVLDSLEVGGARHIICPRVQEWWRRVMMLIRRQYLPTIWVSSIQKQGPAPK